MTVKNNTEKEVPTQKVIDWRVLKNRSNFVNLRASKGNVGATFLYSLYKKLPKNDRKDQANKEIFPSVGFVKCILYNQLMFVSVDRYNLLMKLLTALPDTIDWSNPKNRTKLEALRTKKGNVGELVLFGMYKKLPKKQRLDEDGKEIFTRFRTVRAILAAEMLLVTNSQIDLLMKLLATLPDTIDWSNPKNRTKLEALRAEKGNIGANALFGMYKKLPKEKQLNKNGEEFFVGWNVIDKILRASVKTITVDKYDFLIRLLSTLPPQNKE